MTDYGDSRPQAGEDREETVEWEAAKEQYLDQAEEDPDETDEWESQK